MSKGFVLLGDKTTHGGAVISASSTMIVNGKPVALVGDKVSCPIPGHGTNAIIEGAPEWSSDGKAIVVDGCKCQCGCRDFWRAGMRDRIKNGLGTNKSIDHGAAIGSFTDPMAVCRCTDGDYRCPALYPPCFRHRKNSLSDKYLVGIPDACRMLVADFCLRCYLWDRDLKAHQFLLKEAEYGQQRWEDWAGRWLAVLSSAVLLPDHISAAHWGSERPQQYGLARRINYLPAEEPVQLSAMHALLTSIEERVQCLPEELPLYVTLITDNPSPELTSSFSNLWKEHILAAPCLMILPLPAHSHCRKWRSA